MKILGAIYLLILRRRRMGPTCWWWLRNPNEIDGGGEIFKRKLGSPVTLVVVVVCRPVNKYLCIANRPSYCAAAAAAAWLFKGTVFPVCGTYAAVQTWKVRAQTHTQRIEKSKFVDFSIMESLIRSVGPTNRHNEQVKFIVKPLVFYKLVEMLKRSTLLTLLI